MSRKHTSWILAACIGLVFAPSALGGPKPAGINPVDFKNELRKALAKEKIDFRREFPDLKIQHPCTRKYNDAVKAAEAELAACLNIETAPAGSPLGDYNALNNAQALAFCGSTPADECLAELIHKQKIFCAKEKAKDKIKARQALRDCCSELAEEKKKIENALTFCLGN